MRLDLTMSYYRLQTLFNYMISQHQNPKLRIQPQAVSGSDLSLYKATSWKIFVSGDLVPDITAGLNPVREISWFLHKPSNLYPHISRLQTQIQFVTSLSCELEPNITNPTSRRIFSSADLAPDLSFSLDYLQVRSRVFPETFILNSSCHYFENFD